MNFSVTMPCNGNQSFPATTICLVIYLRKHLLYTSFRPSRQFVSEICANSKLDLRMKFSSPEFYLNNQL